MSKNKRFAVLVDGENIGPKQFLGILKKVSEEGSVAVKRVYADWTNPARSSWKEILQEHAAVPAHQFNHGKDSADHALIMDAIEILVRAPEINAVCIASSDNGYQFLAQRIREKGGYVMGIGRRDKPANKFIEACDDYVFLDTLEFAWGSASTDPEAEENIILDELLKKAFLSCAGGNRAVYLGVLGTSLKKVDPGFVVQDYGFSTLKRLLESRSGLFHIEEQSKDQCFVQLLPAAKEHSSSMLNGRLKRWIENYGFIQAEDGQDYYFTKQSVVSGHRDVRFKPGQSFLFTVSKAPDRKAPPDSAARNGRAEQVMMVGVDRAE